MASTPGFEPGSHWWEASALTTAPPLKSFQLALKRKLKPWQKHIGNNPTGRNIKCVGHKIKEWLTLKIAVVRPFSNFSYGEENFECGRYSSHTNVTRFHFFGHNFDPVPLTTPKCDT